MPRKRKIKQGETFNHDMHRDRRKIPPKATGVFEDSGKGRTFFFEKENVGARDGAPYLGIRANQETGKKTFLYGDSRDSDIPYIYKKPRKKPTKN